MATSLFSGVYNECQSNCAFSGFDDIELGGNMTLSSSILAD